MEDKLAPAAKTGRNTEPSETNLLLPFERQTLGSQYKEYLKAKRQNFFATIQAFPRIWKGFEHLDEIWLRELSDLEYLRDPNQMLPFMLFINAHAQMRTAFQLGFSSCIGDACNVLRSGIESVVYACKIHREPHLAVVWLEKDDGPSQLKAFKDAFERNKKHSLFPSQHRLDKLHRYWSQYSEWATHTTVSSVGRNFLTEDSTTEARWRVNYFEVDPEKLATCLFSLLDAASAMEEAFFALFVDRLDLDHELAKKRIQFDNAKRFTAQLIIRRFKLKPPPIWM